MNDLIQIVKDTDEWTPSPPPGHTFQISILAWIERDGGSVDPWALSRLAVPRLAELVQADRVSAEYWIRTHRGFLRPSHEEFAHSRHWSDLMSRSDAELEREGEFPHRITFEHDGTLVLLEQTGFWSMVGGPMPYHDSVALSFFSGLDIQSKIEGIFLEACGSLGITRRIVESEPVVGADKPRGSD
jgi:hypothetical protein